ncbi:MAG: carboxypeptidase-like regulatory domain-containing protein [Pirellulales bacterium]
MNLKSSWSVLVSSSLMACIVCLTGCGGGESLPADAATVKGVVTHNGSPLAGATITFKQTGGKQVAFGKSDASGAYQLTSVNVDGGTLAGSYTVTVTKYEVTGGDELDVDDPNYDGAPDDEEAEPANLLPEKYGDISTSGLEFKVAVGANDIKIELAD